MKLFQAVVIAIALALTTSIALADDLPDLTKTPGKSRPGLTLWPQAYGSPWKAQQKDKLENRLNKEMCKGAITLKQARDKLRGDWRVAYGECYGLPKRERFRRPRLSRESCTEYCCPPSRMAVQKLSC
jgi:hypothetical protein